MINLYGDKMSSTGQIIVTGAAGFIGSNLVSLLNSYNQDDIILVDSYSAFADTWDWSLKNAKYSKIIEPHALLTYDMSNVKSIYHIGATSNTMESDQTIYFKNNYEYTCNLIDHISSTNIRFINASSSAVYGNGNGPLNAYALSKKMIDEYITKLQSPNIISLRFFNVYGMGEFHKGNMASMVYQLYHQYKDHKELKIFTPGTQSRDFISVDQLVNVLYVIMNSDSFPSGIYDLGSGVSTKFNELLNIIKLHVADIYLQPTYIPMPPRIAKTYQTYTLADKQIYDIINVKPQTLFDGVMDFYQKLDQYYSSEI